MNKFQVGDVVCFKYYSDYDIGYILKCANGNYLIFADKWCRPQKFIVKEELILPADKQLILKTINDEYDNKISDLNSQLQSIKRFDYQDEILEKYSNIKNQIINTCQNLIDDSDDVIDFENKLKAICDKKKSLFSIKCDSVIKAKKHNGAIKWNIKELEQDRDRQINNILKGLENSDKLLNSLK